MTEHKDGKDINREVADMITNLCQAVRRLVRVADYIITTYVSEENERNQLSDQINGIVSNSSNKLDQNLENMQRISKEQKEQSDLAYTNFIPSKKTGEGN